MQATIQHHLKLVKKAAEPLRLLSDDTRQLILQDLAKRLRVSTSSLLAANHKDLERMSKSDPKYDRLLLNEERIEQIARDVESVACLVSPLNQKLAETVRPNGLLIQKISVPIGVVAVIYESRPNVTIDVFSLCFKTGNACVLKGGKEAHFTNVAFIKLIQQSLQNYPELENAVYLLPPEREALHVLLNAVDDVDVCIPRGSQELIHFVRQHAKIPYIETGVGIVHTYFDQSGDLEKGRQIIFNAKTRRVSVCNALDTLIIHEKRLPDLPYLLALFPDKNVQLFADKPAYDVLKGHYPEHLLFKATSEHYGQEFLDYKLSIKTVSSLKEAIHHINTYSSRHSEAIIAQDKTAIDYFLHHVDAAAVYANTSTAFTDGGQFGMGAEIGISTQKIHARGPMALEALTSYKWIVLGNGQIRPS